MTIGAPDAAAPFVSRTARASVHPVLLASSVRLEPSTGLQVRMFPDTATTIRSLFWFPVLAFPAVMRTRSPTTNPAAARSRSAARVYALSLPALRAIVSSRPAATIPPVATTPVPVATIPVPAALIDWTSRSVICCRVKVTVPSRYGTVYSPPLMVTERWSPCARLTASTSKRTAL